MVTDDSSSAAELSAREPRLEAEGTPHADDIAARRLIERAIGGDKRAIAQLVGELLPTVRAVVRARLNSARDGDLARSVDDFSQEIFLRLFAHGGRVLLRWEPERGLPLPRFVALIADRFAISDTRVRRVTDQTVEIHALADLLPAEGPEPDAWLQSRQTLHLMFAALTARLSPLGRKLFGLLFVEELPIDTICRQTGMGADAVYAWRSRLRRKAIQLLELTESPQSTGLRR